MPKQPDRHADPRTKSPRYVRVYTALREWIDNGKYSPGERISSEEEIGRMFDVSRITTRKAIDLLVEDDLVYRLHGKGTYVAENVKQRAGLANIVKRMRDARRMVTTRPKFERIEISEIDADQLICVDLKLLEGARVLRTSYVRIFDNRPVSYSISHIPASIGLEFTERDLRASSTLTLLADMGIKPVSANQLVNATLADASLVDLLGVDIGSPILRIKQIVSDRNQTPIERLIVHYRADRYEHPMVLHDRSEMELVHGFAITHG